MGAACRADRRAILLGETEFSDRGLLDQRDEARGLGPIKCGSNGDVIVGNTGLHRRKMSAYREKRDHHQNSDARLSQVHISNTIRTPDDLN